MYCRAFLACVFAATVVAAGPWLRAAEAAPNDAKLEADGPALLRDWVPPVYPSEQLKQKAGGMVTVRLIVDATGHVTAARAMDDSDLPFVDSALAAVRSWKFEPARERGQPAPCCLETLVLFSPQRGQEKPSRVPPQDVTFSMPPRSTPEPRSSPAGEYPAVLVDRKLPGAVRFSGHVTPEGRLVEPSIHAASHVDFVLPALEALARWEFQPAMQGDLPVSADVEAVMTFDALFDKAADILAANAITARDGGPPTTAPQPSYLPDPVWPLEALLRGEGGSATIEFAVERAGNVSGATVREASQPEYGEALRAAVQLWRFKRIIGNVEAESVALLKRAEFKSVPLELKESADPVERLVIALRAGQIGSAKGLDRRLMPLYRVPPLYPATLIAAEGGAKGRAEIEFIVDRAGRARLPRIVSATQPEFGWAAATAVAQWVFQPPTRGGEPTDIKVRIPIDFAAVPAP